MITIEDIAIIHMIDESPDFSFLGEYTDEMSDWVISRFHEEYVAKVGDDEYIAERGTSYRFFKPYAGGESEGSLEYQEYGMQDYARMEGLNRGDWVFMGIQAEAVVSLDNGRMQRFASGGLWGIESDSGDDYLEAIAREELADLKEHLEAFKVDTSNFDEMAEGAVAAPINR